VSLHIAQGLVREFHIKHGYARDLLKWPDVGSGHNWFEVGVHRSHLINEEHGELMAAWAARDVVKIADGLADLAYVVLGTAVAAGIDLGPILAEVHRSNMTKDPANGVVLHPHKGPNYTAPELKPILRQQGLI
jgi:predicted HAD superfamily Cof-like phosphohydrolase